MEWLWIQGNWNKCDKRCFFLKFQEHSLLPEDCIKKKEKKRIGKIYHTVLNVLLQTLLFFCFYHFNMLEDLQLQL